VIGLRNFLQNVSTKKKKSSAYVATSADHAPVDLFQVFRFSGLDAVVGTSLPFFLAWNTIPFFWDLHLQLR
jgi:hypothetical protein